MGANENKPQGVPAALEEALGQVSTSPANAIPALLKAIAAQDKDIPFWVAYALGRMGLQRNTAIPELIQALRVEADEEYSECRAWNRIGAVIGVSLEDEDVLESLARRRSTLADDSQNVRLWAAHGLGEIGDAAVRPLLEDLQHKEGDLRSDEVAAWSMRRLRPDRPHVPMLMEALRRGNGQLCRWAVTVLARLGEDAVPELTEALDEEEVRRIAVYVLKQIGPPAAPAVPALANALRGDDFFFRQEAAAALGRIGLAAVVPLRELMREDRVRQLCATALGEIGAKAIEAVPELTAALKDENIGVRRAAARALGQIGPEALGWCLRRRLVE